MRTLAILLVVLAGCDDGGDSDPTPLDAGADANAVTCDAPAQTIQCPTGDLPFATESTAFEHPETTVALAAAPEFKDKNLDTLLNPGQPITITGRAARGRGLTSTGIGDEWVSLWAWSASAEWVQLGRTRTADDGQYAAAIDAEFEPGLHSVYAVIEGLGECAVHAVADWPAGTQVVVTDIDETLTTADLELIRQIADPSYDPALRPAAAELIQAWHAKGYKIIYLTARPSDFRQPTRTWLDAHAFPFGVVSTAQSLVSGDTARAYKGDFLNHITDDLGWEIVVAYGNAESDIGGYEDADVPKDVTYIIGESAGAEGTQAVEGDGWAAHIASVVTGFPAAEQPVEDTPFCAAP